MMRDASLAAAGSGKRVRKKSDECARAGSAVHFLFANASQKYEQPENIGLFNSTEESPMRCGSLFRAF